MKAGHLWEKGETPGKNGRTGPRSAKSFWRAFCRKVKRSLHLAPFLFYVVSVWRLIDPSRYLSRISGEFVERTHLITKINEDIALTQRDDIAFQLRRRSQDNAESHRKRSPVTPRRRPRTRMSTVRTFDRFFPR